MKGAEYDRVLVVIDDEKEFRHTHFSAGRYFGYEKPSKTDEKNIDAGKDNVLTRTRRLFYVSCSRARESLAVVVFVPDNKVKIALQKIKDKGIFAENCIHTGNAFKELNV